MLKAKRAEERAKKKAATHAVKQRFDEETGSEGTFATLRAHASMHAGSKGETFNISFPSVTKNASTHAVPHASLRAKVQGSGNYSGRVALSAAVKHQVNMRDRKYCSYILPNGEKCSTTIGIQYDHMTPVAHGGTNDLLNIRLLCREHNVMEAVRVLGEEKMAKYV